MKEKAKIGLLIIMCMVHIYGIINFPELFVGFWDKLGVL